MKYLLLVLPLYIIAFVCFFLGINKHIINCIKLIPYKPSDYESDW